MRFRLLPTAMSIYIREIYIQKSSEDHRKIIPAGDIRARSRSESPPLPLFRSAPGRSVGRRRPAPIAARSGALEAPVRRFPVGYVSAWLHVKARPPAPAPLLCCGSDAVPLRIRISKWGKSLRSPGAAHTSGQALSRYALTPLSAPGPVPARQRAPAPLSGLRPCF